MPFTGVKLEKTSLDFVLKKLMISLVCIHCNVMKLFRFLAMLKDKAYSKVERWLMVKVSTPN